MNKLLPRLHSSIIASEPPGGPYAFLNAERLLVENGPQKRSQEALRGAQGNLGRLDAIKDDNSGSPGDTLAGYTYLGLGTVVREDYEEPDVRLDLWGGTSGTYQGFDRFGRVVDQLWRDYGSSADADRFLYGYDRAGNRLWKESDVAASVTTLRSIRSA